MCVRMYVLYECVYVLMYVHTYVHDPVELRLRHLFVPGRILQFYSQVPPQQGHPCTVDTFLVYFFFFMKTDIRVLKSEHTSFRG